MSQKRKNQKVLKHILSNCRKDDETNCLIWAGATSGNQPRVYAPNLSKDGTPSETQVGRRAVWQLSKNESIPSKWRVFGTCTNSRCLNLEHMDCGPTKKLGEHIKRTGRYKNSLARKMAGRASGLSRTALSPDEYVRVCASNLSGKAEAARLGVSEQTISKARKGKLNCFNPIGGIFSGLLAR